MPGGRPLKFENEKELQDNIDGYFASCFEQKDIERIVGKGKNKKIIREVIIQQIRPFTITGLALYLDTSRKVLCEYEDERPEFSNAIKKAKVKIENFTEEQLYNSKNVAGVIFNLKNNYGWVDKREVDNNHSGKIEHEHSQSVENIEAINRIKIKYEEDLKKVFIDNPPPLPALSA